MMSLLYRFSSAAQSWLLEHPSWLSRVLLFFFYVVEVLPYVVGDPGRFLEKRHAALGPNFAALGRIIVGQYDLVAPLIEAPQARGPYIGPVRCLRRRLSRHFLLFLSDSAYDKSKAHETGRKAILDVLIEPARRRVSSRTAQRYLNECVSSISRQSGPVQPTLVRRAVRTMIVQYMMFVLTGHELSETQIRRFTQLFFSPLPTRSYLASRAIPLALPALFLGRVRRAESELHRLVGESPDVKEYLAVSGDGRLDPDQLTHLVSETIAIAAMLGGESLAVSLLLRVPQQAEVNLDDRDAVRRVVLEATRRWAPVKNINVIVRQSITMNVGNRSRTFPAGTTIVANIGLANLDEHVFPHPFEFDAQRHNLESQVLSFHAVGDTGRRACPGRPIAERMACDLLIAWWQRK